MNEQQQIEVQEKALARCLEWIRHADSKSQIFISLNLAMIGALVAGLPTPDKLNVRSLILLDLGFLLWKNHWPSGKGELLARCTNLHTQAPSRKLKLKIRRPRFMRKFKRSD